MLAVNEAAVEREIDRSRWRSRPSRSESGGAPWRLRRGLQHGERVTRPIDALCLFRNRKRGTLRSSKGWRSTTCSTRDLLLVRLSNDNRRIQHRRRAAGYVADSTEPGQWSGMTFIHEFRFRRYSIPVHRVGGGLAGTIADRSCIFRDRASALPCAGAARIASRRLVLPLGTGRRSRLTVALVRYRSYLFLPQHGVLRKPRLRPHGKQNAFSSLSSGSKPGKKGPPRTCTHFGAGKGSSQRLRFGKGHFKCVAISSSRDGGVSGNERRAITRTPC